ncbi:hypothetical protein AX16_001320 [Volvariella volvacea WC 439]|nr:hypothetical protein AX16_001320 [Volvariella volvacea WC 439]
MRSRSRSPAPRSPVQGRTGLGRSNDDREGLRTGFRGRSYSRERGYGQKRGRSRSRSRSYDSPEKKRRRSVSRTRSRSRSKSRDRNRDYEKKRRSRSREMSRDRNRGKERRHSRSRSRTRRKSRDRDRSRSKSRSRERDRHKDGRHKGKKRDSSTSASESEEESRRKKKHKRDKSKERRRKEKKEKKKQKKAKSHVSHGASWGKYGIISELDLHNKTEEFNTWLVEERMINPETLSKDQQRKEFARFVEDYNTATLPHEKYYHMDAYLRRMTSLREGEFLPPTDTYDPSADLKAISSAHKRRPVERETYLSREQLEELRRVQNERVQVGKMKQLGMDVKQNMGVRMDGTVFDD